MEDHDGVARECSVSAGVERALRIEKRISLVGRDDTKLERELGGIGRVDLHGAGGDGDSYVDAGIGITRLREEDTSGRMARVNLPFRALRGDARNSKYGEAQ